MKYRILPNLVQRSQEWLDFRKGKIGSSLAASIMEQNPYETYLQCWENFFLNRSKEETPAMRRGVALEEEARQKLNELTGRNYEPVVIQSIEYPKLIASLDAYCEIDGVAHIAEIKCMGTSNHQEAIEGTIQPMYMTQMDHIGLVSGCTEVLYFPYNPEFPKHKQSRLIPYQVETSLWPKMIQRYQKFLTSIQNCTPPDPSENDWVDEVDESRISLAQEYKFLAMQIEVLEQRKTELKDRLINGTNHPLTRVGDLKIRKYAGKKVIDTKAIIRDYNVDENAYKKEGEPYWRIILTN